MDKSEDKKYGLKMEAVFPKHVANVRQQVGEARTSEYVKKGNSLLSGLFSILLVSLLLIATFILGVSSAGEDLELTLCVAGFSIYALVLFLKVVGLVREFTDLPDACVVWQRGAVFIIGAYFFAAGYFFYLAVQADKDAAPVESVQTQRPGTAVSAEGLEVIDIPVAGIKIPVPEVADSVVWHTRNRSMSKFRVVFKKFEIKIKVQTVYTSENAKLKEFEEEFCEVMNAKLTMRPSVRPGIHNLGGHDYLAAVGLESSTAEYVLAQYRTIHKGALLDVSVRMPSGAHVPKALDIISEVVSGITYSELQMFD